MPRGAPTISYVLFHPSRRVKSIRLDWLLIGCINHQKDGAFSRRFRVFRRLSMIG